MAEEYVGGKAFLYVGGIHGLSLPYGYRLFQIGTQFTPMPNSFPECPGMDSYRQGEHIAQLRLLYLIPPGMQGARILRSIEWKAGRQ